MHYGRFFVIDLYAIDEAPARVLNALIDSFIIVRPEGVFIEQSHPDFEAINQLISEKEAERAEANKCYSCGESLNYACPTGCKNDDHIPF